jgi:hypothetical protein
VIFGEDHKRQFNEQQEQQATFIAGELLIPLAAAERMAFDGWDNARAAATYGVSEQFAQMQMGGSESARSEQPISTDSGLQLCARDPERSLAVLRADEHPRGRPPGSLQHRHIYDENLELNRRVSINLHTCGQDAAIREKVQPKMRPYRTGTTPVPYPRSVNSVPGMPL